MLLSCMDVLEIVANLEKFNFSFSFDFETGAGSGKKALETVAKLPLLLEIRLDTKHFVFQ